MHQQLQAKDASGASESSRSCHLSGEKPLDAAYFQLFRQNASNKEMDLTILIDLFRRVLVVVGVFSRFSENEQLWF